MKFLAALALFCGACSAGDRYLVARQDLAEVLRLDAAAREKSVVAARRASDGTQTFIRADVVVPEPGITGDVVPVTASVPSKMVNAGTILTGIGAVISIAGTVMFFATDSSPTHWTGGGLAAAAEPIMIVGTALWIVGALKRPQEVTKGRTDLHYIPPR